MIKIHKMDGYKFQHPARNQYEIPIQRNLMYLCMEMTDFEEDIKTFAFLNMHYTFEYKSLIVELQKHVNSKGRLPKRHILYEVCQTDDGLLLDGFRVTKVAPEEIIEHIKEHQEEFMNMKF